MVSSNEEKDEKVKLKQKKIIAQKPMEKRGKETNEQNNNHLKWILMRGKKLQIYICNV